MPFLEPQVNTFTVNFQYSAATTQLPGGGWVITWASMLEDGSGSGIYQQVYDATGAIRDVIQNHLLRFVGYLAMEPPN